MACAASTSVITVGASNTFGTGSGSEPFNYAAGARPYENDVTAPLFLLLRGTDIVSEAFICPVAMLAWIAAPTATIASSSWRE